MIWHIIEMFIWYVLYVQMLTYPWFAETLTTNMSSATWAARWHLFKGKPMQHEATQSYGYLLLFLLSSDNSHSLFKGHMMRGDSWGRMWEASL